MYDTARIKIELSDYKGHKYTHELTVKKYMSTLIVTDHNKNTNSVITLTNFMIRMSNFFGDKLFGRKKRKKPV